MATPDPDQANFWTQLAETAGISVAVSQDQHFTYLQVDSGLLTALMNCLRQTAGMNYLADLTSTDRGKEFEVTYHLYAIPDNGRRLAVKTRVPRDRALLASVSHLYPTADWQEREIFDLMGIAFSGHPHLVRILLPDDFVGHPLRKDFRQEGA